MTSNSVLHLVDFLMVLIIEIVGREGLLFRAGFGRYLAAFEIIRQSPGTDL